MTYEEIVDFTKKKIAKLDASKIEGDLAVQVDVVGEGEGAFYIKVANNQIEVAPFQYFDNDFKIVATAETYQSILELKEALTAATLEVKNDKVNVFDELLHSAKKVTKKAASKTTTKTPAKEASKSVTKSAPKTASKTVKKVASKVEAKPEIKDEKKIVEKEIEKPSTATKKAAVVAAKKVVAKAVK